MAGTIEKGSVEHKAHLEGLKADEAVKSKSDEAKKLATPVKTDEKKSDEKSEKK